VAAHAQCLGSSSSILLLLNLLLLECVIIALLLLALLLLLLILLLVIEVIVVPKAVQVFNMCGLRLQEPLLLLHSLKGLHKHATDRQIGYVAREHPVLLVACVHRCQQLPQLHRLKHRVLTLAM
jgi:hypothetical protein